MCILNRKKEGFRFVVEYYLLLPSVSLQSTENLPDLGKTMYSMYSKHGFPSTIAGGQKAVFILLFTLDCNNQVHTEFVTIGKNEILHLLIATCIIEF